MASVIRVNTINSRSGLSTVTFDNSGAGIEVAGIVTATSFSGSITDTGLTAGRVVYVDSDKSLIDSANLTFNGSDLLIDASTNAYKGVKFDNSFNLTFGSSAGTSPRIYLQGTNNGQSDAGDTFFATGTGGVQKFRSNTYTKFEVNADSTTKEALHLDSDGDAWFGLTPVTHHNNRHAFFHNASDNFVSITSGSGATAGIVFGDSAANTTANYESYIAHYNVTNSLFIHTGQGQKGLELKAGGDASIIDGNLVVAGGHGIDFSAQTQSSATTGSELLNHYEEGTFTPYIDREHNSPILGYAAQDGYYTRIGRVVHFYMEIRVNSYNGNGSYGTTFLRGLPFTASARTGGRGGWDSVTVHTYNTDITTTDGEVNIGVVGANSEKVELYIQRSENSFADIPAPDANDQYKVGGYYFV